MQSTVARTAENGTTVPKGMNDIPTPTAGRVIPATRRRWRHAVEWLLLFLVLAAAAWFTGNNMFRYPQYELDEGTYVGSAWTMIKHGDLFYYTYTYAHPPLGWFQIGLWSTITGGFDRFGMAINSGRVFMLLITIASTYLIFRIIQRDTRRAGAAALAGLLFAAPPLAVSLHRQVYLDNIGTLWLLLSISAVQTARGRFTRIVMSSLAFGVAFLTKEVFVVLFPGMVLIVYMHTHPLQRRFATALWALTAGAAMSLLVLLAILKDELLPQGVLWSSSEPHVSLIETYTRQAGRAGGNLLDVHGSFWKNASLWWNNGPVLMSAGTVALCFSLLFWRKSRLALGIPVLAVLFVLFLGRGGIVIYYYVIPLLALLSLATGIAFGHAANLLARWRPIRPVIAPALLSLCVLLTSSAASRNDLNFVVDNTTAQRLAAQWIVRNVSPNSIIVMDSYAWQDLRDASFTNGRPFPYANYYWPLFSDEQLVSSLLHNNWQKIDYLLISPNTQADARSFNLPLMQEALDGADPIKTFNSGNWAQTILRVRKLHNMRVAEDPLLVRTWGGDKERFITNGRVIVDQNTGETTSPGQASALLRAVYANDRATFDSIWAWTQSNLQVLDGNLLAARWLPGAGGLDPTVSDVSSTEADQDTALALLFASRLWGDAEYERDAVALLDGIWEHETIAIGSTRYVVASNEKRDAEVSLASLAPYAYRIFGKADEDHPWGTLVDSSYSLLDKISQSPDLGGPVGLAPDTVLLDPKTGAPLPTKTPTFSVEGSRLLWRLTVDYLWYHDDRAKQAIGRLHFFKNLLDSTGDPLVSSYAMDGTPIDGTESITMTASVVPSLLVADQPNLNLANSVFASGVLRKYTDTTGGAYWGKDPYAYETQTWAWLTCTLMDGAVVNLWEGDALLAWNDILYQRAR